MVEGFGILCQLPVLHQLVPMQLAPGEDELQLAERQRSADDAASLDVDQGFAAGIFRVKMRRVVIAVKHGDSNSVKDADFLHRYFFLLRLLPKLLYAVPGQKVNGNILRLLKQEAKWVCVYWF